MQSEIDEWVDKAEGDFRTAERDLVLNDYAVGYRYPGGSASKEEARAAVKAMRTIRAFMRQKMGLE